MSVATNGPGNSLVNESSDMPNRTTSQDQRGRVPEPSTLSPPKSESIRPAAYRVSLNPFWTGPAEVALNS